MADKTEANGRYHGESEANGRYHGESDEKDIKKLKESGTNSYASENKKIIKALKKD